MWEQIKKTIEQSIICKGFWTSRGWFIQRNLRVSTPTCLICEFTVGRPLFSALARSSREQPSHLCCPDLGFLMDTCQLEMGTPLCYSPWGELSQRFQITEEKQRLFLSQYSFRNHFIDFGDKDLTKRMVTPSSRRQTVRAHSYGSKWLWDKTANTKSLCELSKLPQVNPEENLHPKYQGGWIQKWKGNLSQSLTVI